MRKLLFCCLCLLLAQPVWAEPENNSSAVDTSQAEVPQAAEQSLPESDASAPDEAQPFETIVRKVEKEIIPLPDCNDEKLLAQTREYVAGYYQKNDNLGVMFRRRRHFVLNALHDFSQEKIADYKTQNARPVSDMIAELKVNQGIIEENMRLCKKQIPVKGMKDIYLLLYPEGEGYKVYVLNLNPKRDKTYDNSFVYAK